jgi:isopentenyl-diphosphate Delta-isomerase
MSDNNLLNIVNKQGEILAVDTRTNIHEKGLLHREVHVWLVDLEGKLIFQRRAKDKDTFPNMLDATAGGYVEIGDDSVTTAIKELWEECGVKASESDLIHIDVIHTEIFDATTNKINNALRDIYVYTTAVDVSSLKIEDGKGSGFEAWSIQSDMNPEQKANFIPFLYNLRTYQLPLKQDIFRLTPFTQ